MNYSKVCGLIEKVRLSWLRFLSYSDPISRYFVFVSRLYFVRFIILICCDKLYFPSPFLQSLLLLLVDPRFKLLEVVCPISPVIAPVVKWTVIKALFSIKKPFGFFSKIADSHQTPPQFYNFLGNPF